MNARVETGAIAAWSGPMTCEQIAKGLRTSVDTVRRIWRAAIEAGSLPSTPRPHFAVRSARPLGADDDDDRDPADGNEYGSAMLLAALQRHHGSDERRRHDDLTHKIAAHEAAQLQRRREIVAARKDA